MKILLAIDGSKSSDCVINELQNLKLDSNTELLAMSAVEKAARIVGEPFGGAVHEYEVTIENQNKAAAHKFLEEAKYKIEGIFSGNLKLEIVLDNPKYAIVETAKKWGADLIIVGSRGYGLWERVLLGSVSTFVVQHAECSVLVSRCGGAK